MVAPRSLAIASIELGSVTGARAETAEGGIIKISRPEEKIAFTIDVLLFDFINAIPIRVECWPPIRPVDVKRNVKFARVDPIAKTSSNLEIGIHARPHVVVGHQLSLAVALQNSLDIPITLGPVEIPDRPGQPRATVCVQDRIIVPPRSAKEVPLIVTPKVAAGESVWTFEVPIARPQLNATTLLQVPVAGVLPNDPAACFYYDFGTSNTALFAPLANESNFVHEIEHSFLRSRIFALWPEGFNELAEPQKFGAPISDRELESDAFREEYCGYAIVDQIKTAFRTGSARPVPVNQLRQSAAEQIVPWYDPPSAFVLFADAQKRFAEHVIKMLRSVPTRVLTALPITLRGQHRARALAAIQQAFTEACKQSVEVEAPLDESTASAMEVLYDLFRRGSEARVIVVDVGGGTTDITCFDVQTKMVKCVGFDGVGLGGEFATDVMVGLIVSRITEELASHGEEGCTVPVGDNSGTARSNLVALRPIAEAAKLSVMKGDDATVPISLSGSNSNGTVTVSRSQPLPSTPTELTIHIAGEEFFSQPEYFAFLSEIVERCEHARNLGYAERYVTSPPTHILLRGQASSCPRLRALLVHKFGVEPDKLSPVDRKISVVRGLEVMNRVLEGSSFQIGGLERSVMLPVGRPDWAEVPLPRFFPLNVPRTLWSPQEVLHGMMGRRELPPPAVKLRPLAGPQPVIQGQVQLPSVRLEPPPGIKKLREMTAFRMRFRYCVWVTEADELYGALFQKSDLLDDLKTVRSHPAVLLLRHLLRMRNSPAPKPEDFEEEGRLHLSLTGDDGTTWVSRVDMLDIARIVVEFANGSTASLTMRSTSSEQEAPWSEWLGDVIDTAISSRLDGYPTITGVRLSETPDELATVAFLPQESEHLEAAPWIYEWRNSEEDTGIVWRPVTVSDLANSENPKPLVNHFERYGLWLREVRRRSTA